MASLTQWTWVWVNSRSWWWTGRPGVLQFMGLQRVGHDWATELNWMFASVLILLIFTIINANTLTERKLHPQPNMWIFISTHSEHILLLLFNHWVVSNSLWSHRLQHARLCWHSYVLAAAAANSKSLQLCPTLCDPIDGSPPGSTVPGILQAKILEWVAISFSSAWKWKWSRSVMSDS